MQLTLTSSDVAGAPPAVKEWLSQAITQEVKTPDVSRVLSSGKPTPDAPTPDAPTPDAPTPDAPTLDELRTLAVNVIQKHGVESLASVLQSAGISRVSECPADKISTLFTELSVRAG
jgi:hypothetical protein